MAEKFKPGDVVQLKSGGPKMTVKEFDEQMGEVHAIWFAGAKHEEGWFPPEALVKA